MPTIRRPPSAPLTWGRFVDQVEETARMLGLDPDDLVIDVITITTSQPLQITLDRPGDRDVYRLVVGHVSS